MTWIFQDTPEQNEKFRKEARRGAEVLKELSQGRSIRRALMPGFSKHQLWLMECKLRKAMEKERLKFAFAFDDAIVTIELSPDIIKQMTVIELAEYLFALVINEVRPKSV